MKIDYSIIIPAYNEEAYLENTLWRLQETMKATTLTGEIIVTDNNSTDRTSEIATKMGATTVYEPVNQISRARNAGAKQAQGRYLVFVDADTVIEPALLQTALNNLETGKCVGGGATVTTDSEIPILVKLILGYWNVFSRITRLAAGCFMYTRRDDFETVGGFSENVYATEEIWLSMDLKRQGRKSKRKFCIINQPKAISSGRKLDWYNHIHHLLLLFMIFLFPFFSRFKWACGYWYKRPEK